MRLSSFLKEFIEMTKPKVWIFLLITGIAGLLFAMAITKKINPFDIIYIIIIPSIWANGFRIIIQLY